MTQEEKSILLKDLCARLPYGVIINVHDTYPYTTLPYFNMRLNSSVSILFLEPIFKTKDRLTKRILKEHEEYLEFRPYLRPMSSMTEEEMEDYARYKFSSDEIWEIVDFKRTGKGFINVHCKNRNNTIAQWTFQVNQKSPLENYKGIDWLITNHFDFRGLVGMGLALPASEDMYK